MGRPILGSSDLPITGENRCSRKCVNTKEGPKFVTVKRSKGFRLHLTEMTLDIWWDTLRKHRWMSSEITASRDSTLAHRKWWIDVFWLLIKAQKKLNRELSTKLIWKNSLNSTAHKSQVSDKRKLHSVPKQRHPLSTEVLSNWPSIMWLQLMTSSA
jgi:hypothetical protein